jgi:DNA-binding PadR family transcriptional regulator
MTKGRPDRAKLGELEELVLLAVLRRADEAYGLAIKDELETRGGRHVSRGALYLTLDRLQAKGLLSARRGEPRPERGGRARRYVAVTSDGLEALRRARRARSRLSDGLEPLLEER